MSYDPANTVIISGHTEFRGVAHHAKGDVTETPIRTMETFKLGASGRKVSQVKTIGYEVTVPIVAPFADLVPILKHWSQSHFGRALAPHQYLISEVDGTGIAVTGHTLANGSAVYLCWDEVAPTISGGALSKTTVYYFRADGANAGSLHLSEADANAGDDPINFTGAGVGGFWLAHEFPLYVHRRSGVKRTYHNAVVKKLPTIKIVGGEQVFSGDLVFRVYPQIGSAPSSGSAAFWTESNNVYVPATYDPNSAITAGPLNAEWGAAPFDDMLSENGWTLDLEPTVKEFGNGIWPEVSGRLTEFKATVKGTPMGITRPQYEARVAEILGAHLALSTFSLWFGDSWLFTFEGMGLSEQSKTMLSTENAHIGELTWVAHGSADSDIKPAFTIIQD